MKYTLHGTLAIVGFIALAVTLSPATTHASPNGNAWGYYGMSPGHMLQQHHYRYWWNNKEFDDIEEFRAYIREYLRVWRELHGQKGTKHNTDDDGDIQVTTKVATDIEEDQAIIEGFVDLNDAKYAHVWFEYGDRANDLDGDTTRIKIDDDDSGSFEAKITGLDDDEAYYFRAVGEDDDGKKDYGIVRSFVTDEDEDSDDTNTDDDEPEVSTNAVENIEDDSAELRGEVDMNDFNNGIVFFVYGEDRNLVEDVADDYDTYDAIDEDGDDLQKVLVDNDLDSNGTYTAEVWGLDADTTHYMAIGVQYEDEDGDDVLMLGAVRTFTTDQ